MPSSALLLICTYIPHYKVFLIQTISQISKIYTVHLWGSYSLGVVGEGFPSSTHVDKLVSDTREGILVGWFGLLLPLYILFLLFCCLSSLSTNLHTDNEKRMMYTSWWVTHKGDGLRGSSFPYLVALIRLVMLSWHTTRDPMRMLWDHTCAVANKWYRQQSFLLCFSKTNPEIGYGWTKYLSDYSLLGTHACSQVTKCEDQL